MQQRRAVQPYHNVWQLSHLYASDAAPSVKSFKSAITRPSLPPCPTGADLLRIVGILSAGMVGTLLFTAQITVVIREWVKTPVKPVAKGKVGGVKHDQGCLWLAPTHYMYQAATPLLRLAPVKYSHRAASLIPCRIYLAPHHSTSLSFPVSLEPLMGADNSLTTL